MTHVISTPLTEKVPPKPKQHASQVPRVILEKQDNSLSATVPRVPGERIKYIPPKSTAEYLHHNSTRRRLRWQNRATMPVTNCGLELKKQLAASINMTIESDDHKTHPSKHRLNAVLDEESGKLLEYHHLLKTKHKEIWSNACSKEFAHLCQGQAQDDTPFTNTNFFIAPHELPPGKKPTYLHICADFRPQKKDPHQIHNRRKLNQIQWCHLHTNSRLDHSQVTSQQCQFGPRLAILWIGCYQLLSQNKIHFQRPI